LLDLYDEIVKIGEKSVGGDVEIAETYLIGLLFMIINAFIE